MRYIYFGKRLRAGVELPPIICFFIYTAGADKTISVIAALFLHELGHIAAALIRGRLPESVTLSAAGIAALLILYLLSVSVLFCTGSNVSLLILCASVFSGTYIKRGKFNNMI